MKKILLSILISFIGLVGFGYCNYFVNIQTVSLSSNGGTRSFDVGDCVIITSAGCSNASEFYNNSNEYLGTLNGLNTYSFFCFSEAGYGKNTYTQSCTWRYGNLTGLSVSCPTCEEQYTSEECQQEYSLMPISSCDSEYCQLNELCGTGSSGSGDLQWSSLFINGIQHVGGSIIDVTIPSEIQRNYIYTGENEETFKLDIEGLNGDPDYIQGIIDVNSYRPTSEDFTNTFVGGLTLIFPYIIVTAFIVFIWRFIRKIFK